MTNIKLFIIIKKSDIYRYWNEAKEIYVDNARIKMSLFLIAINVGSILWQQSTINSLSAKFQDNVNAKLFILTQWLNAFKRCICHQVFFVGKQGKIL